MDQLKHRIGIIYTKQNFQNKIVIKNLLSLSDRRGKSMRYPESLKVIQRTIFFNLALKTRNSDLDTYVAYYDQQTKLYFNKTTKIF